MADDVYQQLAVHLDHLPGGFPATPEGIELQILRLLFTPEEAALAVHLTLIPEQPEVIAYRAKLPLKQTEQMLQEMAAKGLILDVPHRTRPTEYMAAQFVVGIWEYQVNRLTPELVALVDQYFKVAFDHDTWREAPQLRTIPIGASLPQGGEVLPYMLAEEIVRRHTKFAVTPCVCRQERQIAGDACGKPLEMCLSMDGAAEFYLRHGRSREITLEEALHLLEVADQSALVLQPGNTQDTNFICCCCGDCCGVLRNVRRHPEPASVVSSGYYAVCEVEICVGCGDCVTRCQMDAVSVDDGFAVVDLKRCIGCGLCVTGCSTGAMRLEKKPEQRKIPANIVESMIHLGRERGVLDLRRMAQLVAQSRLDRLRARNLEE